MWDRCSRPHTGGKVASSFGAAGDDFDLVSREYGVSDRVIASTLAQPENRCFALATLDFEDTFCRHRIGFVAQRVFAVGGTFGPN